MIVDSNQQMVMRVKRPTSIIHGSVEEDGGIPKHLGGTVEPYTYKSCHDGSKSIDNNFFRFAESF